MLPCDFYLDADVPVARFTGDSRPQDLDSFAHDLLALVSLLRGSGGFPLFDEAQFFGYVHRPQPA